MNLKPADEYQQIHHVCSLTSLPCDDTVAACHARGLLQRGAEMDWRLFSAVTLAGASFSMVAFGAYTLRAADSVPRDAGRSAPRLVAPSLAPFDVSGAAVTVRQNRGVAFVPVAPNGAKPGDAEATPVVEYPAHSGTLVAAVEEASPVLVADLPVQRDNIARSWHHAHHVTWRRGHHARFCTLLRPCGADRKQQVAVKHGDGHAAPKIALILGVGF